MSFRKSWFTVLFRWPRLTNGAKTLAVTLLLGLSVSALAMAVDPSQPKDAQGTNQTPAGASNEDLSHRIKLLELKAADPAIAN
jgi:hypothetical protein